MHLQVKICHILKNTHSVTFYTVICVKSNRMCLKGHKLRQKWQPHDMIKAPSAQCNFFALHRVAVSIHLTTHVPQPTSGPEIAYPKYKVISRKFTKQKVILYVVITT